MTKLSPPHEDDARFRLGSLAAVVLVVVTFSFIGAASSAVWHSVAPKVFESSATVLIEPRVKILNTAKLPIDEFEKFIHRHDQLIGEDNIVVDALEKYGLAELTTLRDLSRDNQINHIQLNLAIQRSQKNLYLYHLRFRSRDARDAQTVLATIVKTYEKQLAEQYPDPRQEILELLHKRKNRLANDLETQIAEVEQIEKQIAAGQTLGKRLEQLKEKVELTRKKLDQASRQCQEQYTSLGWGGHPGFNFVSLSPASDGFSVLPPLPVVLLLGGCGGALFGLIPAGLMIFVLK